MKNDLANLARFKTSMDRFRDVFAAIAVVCFVIAATCFAEIALYLRGMA